MPKINKNQIIALRTAAGKVFPDDDSYRDWLAKNFLGVCSTKDLDRQQATRAITMLRKQCGYKDVPLKRGRTRFPAPGGGLRSSTSVGGFTTTGAKRITPEQRAKITGLCELLAWDVQSKPMFKFIERQTGQKSAVQMLLTDQAGKVIIGMQKIIAAGDQKLYNWLNSLTAADLKNPGVQETLTHIKRKILKC